MKPSTLLAARVLFAHSVRRFVYSRRLHVLGAVALAAMLANGFLARRELEGQRELIAELQLKARDQNTIDRVFLPRPAEEFVYVDRTGSDQFPPYLIATPWGIDTPLGSAKGLDRGHVRSPDWRLIFPFCFVMLVLLISYDSVAADVETGRWRLLLAQPISRGSLLLANLAACFFVTLSILVGSLLANLGVVTLTGTLPFSLSLVIRYGWSSLLLGLGLAVACLIGFTASCLFRTSRMAFLAALAVWVILVVLVPVASAELAALVRPDPSPYELEQAIRGAQYEFYDRVGPISSEEISAVVRRHLPAEVERQSIRELEQSRLSRNLAALEQFKSRVSHLRAYYLTRMQQQAQLRLQIDRISPFEVVYQGLDSIFAAGLEFQQAFQAGTREYVNVLAPTSYRLQREWLDRAVESGPKIEESGYVLHQVLWVDFTSLPREVLGQLPYFEFQTPWINIQGAAVSVAALVIHLLLWAFLASVAATRLRPV